MDIHQEICNLLQYHTSLPLEEIQVLLATPPDPKMGDYAFPCFKLTSAQNKNPKDVATKLQTQLTKNIPNYLNRIEINGPYSATVSGFRRFEKSTAPTSYFALHTFIQIYIFVIRNALACKHPK